MSTADLGTNIPPAPAKRAKAAPIGLPETVRIILEENDSIPPTGQFFGVNGRSYMLRPGVEAEVPQGIIDVLDNAVTSSPIIDPDTQKVIGYRNAMRYPYRRIMQKNQGVSEDDL